MRTTSLGLIFLWKEDDDQTWLLHKFHMLRSYNLITTKRTNCYCKKSCESKINMKFIIFCKHMAILSVQRQRNHISYFCIYQLFKNHLSSSRQVKSITQSYYIQWTWNFYHSTHIESVAYHKKFTAIGAPQLYILKWQAK